MYKSIGLLVGFLSLFLMMGCSENQPKPTAEQPTSQATNQLENFSKNWPPKDKIISSVPLSNFSYIVNYLQPSDTSQLSLYALSGTSMIYGRVALKTTDSQIVYGRYANVYLLPYISYFKQWLKGSSGDNVQFYALDTKAFAYIKSAQADSKGEYSFRSIAKGRYFVVAVMSCGEECGFGQSKSIRMISDVYVSGSILKNIIQSF